jgi:arylsulfatase
MSSSQLPPGLQLAGRERLQRRGVTFANHQINSAVCSSSRSVIYTGQHIQRTRVFDNLNFPWSNDLSTEIPTLGDMLGEAGYYTAYKGKWHMSRAMDTHDAEGRRTLVLGSELGQPPRYHVLQHRRLWAECPR